MFLGFPDGSDGKEFAFNTGDLGLIPGLVRSPGGGNLQCSSPTPVFLPGEFHGQNSMDTLVFLLGEWPWTEEPGGLQSMGLQRVRHD